jgi:hypothetical protein
MRAARPDHRSVCRSRRRRVASVCGGVSYLAGYSAAVLGAASLVAETGAQALRALALCAAFAVLAVVMLAIDRLLTRPAEPVPLRLPACGTSGSSSSERVRAAFI